MFSFGFYAIFNNTYFMEHLRRAAECEWHTGSLIIFVLEWWRTALWSGSICKWWRVPKEHRRQRCIYMCIEYTNVYRVVINKWKKKSALCRSYSQAQKCIPKNYSNQKIEKLYRSFISCLQDRRKIRPTWPKFSFVRLSVCPPLTPSELACYFFFLIY